MDLTTDVVPDIPELVDRIEDIADDSAGETYTEIAESQNVLEDESYREQELDDNEWEKIDGDPDSEWLDIIGSGDLKKKVIKEGQGRDTRPLRGKLVTLRLKGQMDDGVEVDCKDCVQFPLGEGDMLQAWEICIPTMELGEVCTLLTSSRFAYGEIGREPDIPANASITYELELLQVDDPLDLETLPLNTRCTMGDAKRERGNQLFVRTDYSGAINSYTLALKILNASQTLDEASFRRLQHLKVKCYNNLAAAQIKVEAYGAALKSCDWVLDKEEDNVKALFRKGKVLACQGEISTAISVIKKSLKLEPSNKTIHQELSRIVAQQAKLKEEEKKMYKKMVGDMADMAETLPKTKWSNMYSILAIVGILLAVLIAVLVQSQ